MLIILKKKKNILNSPVFSMKLNNEEGVRFPNNLNKHGSFSLDIKKSLNCLKNATTDEQTK